GFAAAVGAQQGESLASIRSERNIVHCHMVAVSFRQVAYFDHNGSSPGASNPTSVPLADAFRINSAPLAPQGRGAGGEGDYIAVTVLGLSSASGKPSRPHTNRSGVLQSSSSSPIAFFPATTSEDLQ